jgi:tetratricopeptide (TPR) repeat protein
MLCLPAFGQMTAEDWFAKGIAAMNQSNYYEASQAFDKAIKINPRYVEAWAGKGWALYGGGKYTDALKTYNKAIDLNPNYPDAWAGKGFAF